MLDHLALAVTSSRGRVYVGTVDGTICAFRQTTGRVDWRRLASVPVAGDPVTDDRYLYVARLDSTLKRYDARRGTLIESVTLPSRPIAGPRLAGDQVALPLASGTMAFVSRSRPARLTRLTPAGPPRLDAMLTSADAATVVTLGIADGARFGDGVPADAVTTFWGQGSNSPEARAGESTVLGLAGGERGEAERLEEESTQHPGRGLQGHEDQADEREVADQRSPVAASREPTAAKSCTPPMTRKMPMTCLASSITNCFNRDMATLTSQLSVTTTTRSRS